MHKGVKRSTPNNTTANPQLYNHKFLMFQQPIQTAPNPQPPTPNPQPSTPNQLATGVGSITPSSMHALQVCLSLMSSLLDKDACLYLHFKCVCIYLHLQCVWYRGLLRLDVFGCGLMSREGIGRAREVLVDCSIKVCVCFCLCVYTRVHERVHTCRCTHVHV